MAIQGNLNQVDDPQHQNTDITIEDGVPVSLTFGDVYFSKEGGWEESKYVFWKGNKIPEVLANGTNLPKTIGELGFGTGLNLFMTLHEWSKMENPPNFTFYSLEGFPLQTEILHSLHLYFPDKVVWTETLLTSYNSQLEKWKQNPKDQIWKTQFLHSKGKHTFDLHLYFGDVESCLDFFPKIDFWYLDGFSPSKNQAMWSETTLSKIRSHSDRGTRLATFTAAGFIRRNLEGLGFRIQKQKGFGKKREMITGVLE